MSRKLLFVAAAAALALTTLPIEQVGATPSQASSGFGTASKSVAAGEYDSYIVVLKADPLVTSYDRKQLSSPKALAAADALRKGHDKVLTESGVAATKKVQDYTAVLNGFSARVSHFEAVRLAANPKVAMVFPDELRQLTSTPGIDSDNVDDGTSASEEDFLNLTGGGEAYAAGITGERVLVGVIDSGIWPEHPSFADDGTYPKAPSLTARGGRPKCDFGQKSHNKNDVPFVCNNKLVAARQILNTYRALIGADPDEFDSARDDDGHGTHTASTAAGNADVDAYINGRFIDSTSGIAPRAQIIAYKGLGNLGGFSSDLTAAIDQAVTDGVDVINYSVGGGPGLVGSDTIAYLFAARAGVFVANSAGNAGPGPETIGGPADVPWLTSVGASTEDRFYEGVVTLGNGASYQGSSATLGLASTGIVDADDAGNPLCIPGEFTSSVAGKVVLCSRGTVGRVAKSLAVREAGGVGMVMFNVDVPNQDNLFTDNFWVPTVHVDQVVGLAIRAYIDAQGTAATASISIGNITQTPWDVPSMTVFSSRGPNPSAASLIKPDITAPGIQVLAGASPFADPDSPQGHLFQAIAGTSMSSPQIAGIFALLKQARPTWSPAMAKSAIMTSAHQNVRKNDRVTMADPFDFGAGHVNPGVVAAPGMFNPGLVYNATFNSYLGFLCDAGPEVFADAAATCAALAAAGIPTRTEDLNVPSIGVSALAGSETVLRRVTNVASGTVAYTASWENPAGYTVSVDPPSVTLPPGASANVEVTITNDGTAAIGEWAFGSLTWEGSGFSVRSPIAVRGTDVAVDASVVGSGETGTAEIAVKFGYDGAYLAQPKGLTAVSLLSGDLAQDPDQTFTPGDPASPGLVYVPVAIDDAPYARIELVIPGDDDIDLYLLDGSNNIVAQSTAGGTDELIELSYPAGADGPYTLAVHGWSVNVALRHFDLSTWFVPNAAGSLTVDSAPPTAVIGAVGTVTVSWTGATPAGSVHYGVVDHTDGSDVLAQTVVKVTG